MRMEPFVERILDDEGLRGDLDDETAAALTEWAVGQVGKVVQRAPSESVAWKSVEAVARRARLLSQFVSLWCNGNTIDKARQFMTDAGLAASLPPSTLREPVQVLQHILEQEAGSSFA